MGADITTYTGLQDVIGAIRTDIFNLGQSLASQSVAKQNAIASGQAGVAIGYSGTTGTVQAATKLGSSTVGSTSQPIYLLEGTPVVASDVGGGGSGKYLHHGFVRLSTTDGGTTDIIMLRWNVINEVSTAATTASFATSASRVTTFDTFLGAGFGHVDGYISSTDGEAYFLQIIGVNQFNDGDVHVLYHILPATPGSLHDYGILTTSAVTVYSVYDSCTAL